MEYQNNYNENPRYGNDSGVAGSADSGNGGRWKPSGAVPPPFPGERRPQPPYPPRGNDGYASRYPRQRSESNGIGTAGFVLALISFLGFWLPYVNGLTWLLGLIFSVIGVTRPPRGLAVAGLVISVSGLVLIVLAFLFLGFLFTADNFREMAGFI